MSDSQLPTSNSQLQPFAGNWVALVGDSVAGVGKTAEEAQLSARNNRPREKFVVRFIEGDGGNELTLSNRLDEVREFLSAQPFPVYLVGGAVRDAVLGIPSHDLDFVVPQDAIKLAFKVADALGVAAYPMDKERDVGRVVFPDGLMLDFARFRNGGTLEGDLADRDFTFNALALPVNAKRDISIIDPLGGLADLKNRRIRQAGATALSDDPIRALRAVRMAIKHKGGMTQETAVSARNAIQTINIVSKERVRDELNKILMSRAPHSAVRTMHRLGMLPFVLPEVASLEGVDQTAPHHEQVLPHTISVLQWLLVVEKSLDEPQRKVPELFEMLQPFKAQLLARLATGYEGEVNGRLLLRLAALLHDIGKMPTQSVDADGRIRFFNHEKVGAEMSKRILRRLKFSNDANKLVEKIVDGHMRPLLLATEPSVTRRAIFRFCKKYGEATPLILLHALADHLAISGTDGNWQKLTALTTSMLTFYFNQQAPEVKPAPLLTGSDIMREFELGAGKEIGRLLSLVEEAQMVGEIGSRDEALALVRKELGV